MSEPLYRKYYCCLKNIGTDNERHAQYWQPFIASRVLSYMQVLDFKLAGLDQSIWKLILARTVVIDVSMSVGIVLEVAGPV